MWNDGLSWSNDPSCEKRLARRRLRKLLIKLSIKSADDHLEELIANAAMNFGKPDVIYMNPRALEDFTKAFNT